MHEKVETYNATGTKWITFQNKEEWLKLRKNSIGASEVAAALGISKYRTRYDLFLDKLNENIDYVDNESMYWGRAHENAVAIRFSEETGLKLRKENKIRLHQDYDYLSATLDRTIVADPDKAAWLFLERFPKVDPAIFNKPGILEIKTVRGYAYDKWDADIAPEYWCQIQHQFDVTGYEWGFFAILVDGNRYFQYAVLPDQVFIENQRDELIEFWTKYIEPETAPPMEAKDYEKLELKEDVIELQSDDLMKKYERHWIVANMIKKLTEEKDELQDAMKLAIGNHKKLICNSSEICNFSEYKQFDSTKLKKDDPVLYSSYQTKTVRRFNVKGL